MQTFLFGEYGTRFYHKSNDGISVALKEGI